VKLRFSRSDLLEIENGFFKFKFKFLVCCRRVDYLLANLGLCILAYAVLRFIVELDLTQDFSSLPELWKCRGTRFCECKYICSIHIMLILCPILLQRIILLRCIISIYCHSKCINNCISFHSFIHISNWHRVMDIKQRESRLSGQ